jgi:hypothetical protein
LKIYSPSFPLLAQDETPPIWNGVGCLLKKLLSDDTSYSIQGRAKVSNLMLQSREIIDIRFYFIAMYLAIYYDDIYTRPAMLNAEFIKHKSLWLLPVALK